MSPAAWGWHGSFEAVCRHSPEHAFSAMIIVHPKQLFIEDEPIGSRHGRDGSTDGVYHDLGETLGVCGEPRVFGMHRWPAAISEFHYHDCSHASRHSLCHTQVPIEIRRMCPAVYLGRYVTQNFGMV